MNMASIDSGRRSTSPAGSTSSGTLSKQRPAVSETIRFNEAAGDSGFLINEDSTLISVYPSRSTQMLPESKLKIRNLVDYSWDVTYGTGRMLSTHLSGKYIAYVVRIANAGGVRIVDIQTHDRVLIKGSRGLIRDVEFMHKMDDLIVGFIDEYGTVYIYKIVKDPQSNLMQTLLILEVAQPGGEKLDCRRFIWCKYIPDDATQPFTPTDGSYHFAVIQNDRVYVTNLCQLIDSYGEGRHSWADFKKNYMDIDAHTGPVLDASFAPDGTALATASVDGTVKFFQVYLIGNDTTLTARCLYSWPPHGGKPVTGLFFLDDHSTANSYEPEKHYWKYLLTAGQNMSEVKLWTCKDWICLQTIKLCCPSPSQLKMDLNLTAKFLVMSDIHRKCMFVISVTSDEDTARFEWISEFSLPCCMISLNINNARTMTLRQIEAAGFEEYVVNEMESTPAEEYCILDISYVQPKSLQQGNVAFPPPKVAGEGPQHATRISFDQSVSYIEGKADDLSESPESSSEGDQEAPVPESKMKSPSSQANANQANLMKSDRRSTSPLAQQPSTSLLSQQLSSLLLTNSGTTFSNGGVKPPTSAERAKSLPPLAALGILTSPNAAPVTQTTSKHDDNTHMMPRESPSRVRGSGKNSESSQASSSPSREVEEILSPKTTEQQHTHKYDIIQNTDETLAVNNFDIEGNVLQDDYNSNYNTNTKPLDFSSGALCDIQPSTQMPQVLERVSSIMQMMQDQAQEMRDLKREVSRLNNAQLINPRQLDEQGFARILEKYFSQNSLQIQRIEDCLKNQIQLDKQRRATTHAIPPNFAEAVTADTGRLLKHEMEKTVLPSILTLFEPVRTQVQAELVKMVMNAETRIKQDLKQAIQSPDFRNSITSDIEGNLKLTCESIIPRVLLTSIVPNFEKSLQSLYVKINETFLKGTKEYIGGLEGTLESRRSQEVSSQEEIKDQLSSMQDNISSVLQVELESQMMRVLNNLQSTLVKQIEESVVRELGRAFKDQRRYLEESILPRAVTPALSVSDHGAVATPPVDPEALMRHMFKQVEKGDIAGAFVQASHYADIAYMIRLAERVNPNSVFTSKLPTQTHVAIIQHMAADLMSNTDVKVNYLNVAISTLNTSDRKTLKSVARIIPVFQTSVRKFAESAPGSPHLQGLRLLEMAFVGMCSQFGNSPMI